MRDLIGGLKWAIRNAIMYFGTLMLMIAFLTRFLSDEAIINNGSLILIASVPVAVIIHYVTKEDWYE